MKAANSHGKVLECFWQHNRCLLCVLTMENKNLFRIVGEEDNKEMLEKNSYGIIKPKRWRESGSRGICEIGSAVLSGLCPLLQMLLACGFPSSQQVLPAWPSPLSCKSSWSVGCFSLLLIHFFSLTRSFFLLPKKSFRSAPSGFSRRYFHSSLLNVPPLGYPFKQVPKPTGPPAFSQSQVYHSAGWKWGGSGAAEGWCLLFKTNLKYLTLKLFTQGLRSMGLWSISRGCVKQEIILGQV